MFDSGKVPLFSGLSVVGLWWHSWELHFSGSGRHSAKGFSPQLTYYTNHRPCGTPLDPPETPRRHLFLGEETCAGKADGGKSRCGKTQSKSGLSSGYLHTVSSSSRRLWTGWKQVRRNVWILVAYLSSPSKCKDDWLSATRAREIGKQKDKSERLGSVRKAKKRWAEPKACYEREDLRSNPPVGIQLEQPAQLCTKWRKRKRSDQASLQYYRSAVRAGGQVATLPKEVRSVQQHSSQGSISSTWCLWGSVSVATPCPMRPRSPLGTMQILDQNQNPKNWTGIALAQHWSTG